MYIILSSLSDHPTTETSAKKNRHNYHGKDCESPRTCIASCIEHGCRVCYGVDDIPHVVTFLFTNATWIYCLIRSSRGSKRELGADVRSLIIWSLGNISSLTRTRKITCRLNTRIIILCSRECYQFFIILSFCGYHVQDHDGDQGRDKHLYSHVLNL